MHSCDFFWRIAVHTESRHQNDRKHKYQVNEKCHFRQGILTFQVFIGHHRNEGEQDKKHDENIRELVITQPFYISTFDILTLDTKHGLRVIKFSIGHGK